MVFQAQIKESTAAGKSDFSGLSVEIERYNEKRPAELPPDEQITRTAKTDPNGVVTCTLPDPGWWCITAQRGGGMRERDGKSFPVKYRATHWVFVDERAKKQE
jgi:hypothetical protein